MSSTESTKKMVNTNTITPDVIKSFERLEAKTALTVMKLKDNMKLEMCHAKDNLLDVKKIKIQGLYYMLDCYGFNRGKTKGYMYVAHNLNKKDLAINLFWLVGGFSWVWDKEFDGYQA